MKLPTLVAQFDRDCDGFLTDTDVLRMLSLAAPALREKQLNRCLLQLRTAADKDRDGRISLQVGY